VRFGHSDALWRDFPGLVPGVLAVEGISRDVDVRARLARFTEVAASRLASASEGELPEIQAWRRAFSQLGLKPTQYRCASEALLRRFRKEGSLPEIHPLIDVCNAVSLAFATPVAVFDLDRVEGDLEVRHAAGAEIYETFAGDVETPEAGEVVFADSSGRAHARRWTNRQSGYSAVRPETARVLVVAEALHAAAGEDVPRLVETLATEVEAVWAVTPRTAILSRASPRFDVA